MHNNAGNRDNRHNRKPNNKRNEFQDRAAQEHEQRPKAKAATLDPEKIYMDRSRGDQILLNPGDIVIPVNKGLHVTSADITDKLKYWFRSKVGHAGTLDPLASGLLITCLNGATKLVTKYQEATKIYTFTMRLGEETPSYDASTNVTSRNPDWVKITEADLEEVRKTFLGETQQTVPVYSAVRVGGQRLYKSAHKGVEVAPSSLPSRPIFIYDLQLLKKEGSDVTWRVTCSKGTFVRSLAHDMGKKLGVGAHVVALHRDAIGPYRAEDAWTMAELEALVQKLKDQKRAQRQKEAEMAAASASASSSAVAAGTTTPTTPTTTGKQ